MAARRIPSAAACLLVLAAALSWPAGPLRAEDEDPERESILALISPRAGESIADVGCGKGTWTFPLARAVGGHGHVYAVDIDREKLAEVHARKKRDNVQNVTVVHSVPDDPMLPEDALDAVFLNDVIDYVDRSALAGFLAGIRSSLKPAGRLIIRDPNGAPDRVIAECYRAGFTLVEARIPLTSVPSRAFTSGWYALELRRADAKRPAILPRLGEPRRYRTRLHLAEELFRADLIDRETLRVLWETIQNAPGHFDPEVDEALDLIRAARAAGVLTEPQATDLTRRARRERREGD